MLSYLISSAKCTCTVNLVLPSLLLLLLLFVIISGSWKTKDFKAYNFDALGIRPDSGHLHPLLKVRTQFRQIFLEMGSVIASVIASKIGWGQ